MLTKLEYRRSTAPVSGFCMCNEPTNRLIQFKLPHEEAWNAIFMCDACVDGIKKMAVQNPGDV